MSAMSVTHRGRPAAPVRDGVPVSTAAGRVGRHRWQDPRLWAGILLVSVSVLLGGWLLAAADDTVPVWRVTAPLEPGDALTAASVSVAQVRLPDDAAAAYLSAESTLPDGLRVDRPIAAGELVPVAAVSDGTVQAPRRLPLGIAAAGVPSGLAPGDVVDVWAVPPADARGATSSRVLAGVRVSALSDPGPSGIAGDRQVLVDVPDGVDLGQVLDDLNGAAVVLVRVGG